MEGARGNIVLKHPLSDEELLKTIDGNMKSCLPRTKMIEWRIDFGSRLRVAVVFLRLSWQFRDIEPYMKIETGFGNTKRKCMQTTEVVQNEDLGVYVDCEGVQMATYVAVNKIGHQRSLCEVEIFQTKTINVAARRPLLDSNERIYTGNLKPELCNDQRIDKVYSLRQNGHWAVDFLLRLDLKLMRIITDREYEMSIIEGLSILTGELPPFRKYGVKKVKDLTYNTKGNINTITFTRKIEARSLHVRSKNYLRVLEVEVYRGSLLDVREDECLKADACPPNFKCSNWPKQFSCECPTEGFRYVEEGHGKTRNKKCLDIDECKEQDSCPVTYSHCKNTLGSYLCLCNKGHEAIYDSDNRLQKCEDLDECKHPLLFNGCPKLSRCENLPGSYTCACEPGYESTEQYSDNDKAIECEEKDECNDESSCPVDHSYCINLKGSYDCTCNEGFKNVYDSNDRLKNCQDVDECKHPNTFRCPERSACVNLAGSYTCECAQGYEPAIRSKTRGRDIKCKDVDECKEKTYSCHVKSTCTNSVGSYSCQCPLGMKGDGRTHCLELDPCTEDKKCKQKHQTCKDIKGELLCDCMDGFIRKAHQCKDKNECELNGTICNYHSQCINTEGSYYCKCKPGYQRTSGGETNCADYDECKDPHICGPHEKCTNQPATYECSCSDGFESQDDEKLNCTDIDECFTNTYKCDSNSYCANSFGSYDCKCKGGYKKNSRGYCEEQCYEDCPEKSECKNGICRCLPGYAFGPFRECYKDDFFVATGSGKSVYLHKIPLVIGQLIYLACNVRINLTVF
ncbi:latent-transforming growth factor beta-binding protein 1-like isoform X2 [Montipora capricornis]|uniref:latent-transforming growth factor beta-binding protein 1-like isoform X2 n=1 Tax=Montipora capricornis TaxID=246305 RepID=UPI0035F17D43